MRLNAKWGLGFRVPAFVMSFCGSTNSRGKIGTARSQLQKVESISTIRNSCSNVFEHNKSRNVLVQNARGKLPAQF